MSSCFLRPLCSCISGVSMKSTRSIAFTKFPMLWRWACSSCAISGCSSITDSVQAPYGFTGRSSWSLMKAQVHSWTFFVCMGPFSRLLAIFSDAAIQHPVSPESGFIYVHMDHFILRSWDLNSSLNSRVHVTLSSHLSWLQDILEINMSWFDFFNSQHCYISSFCSLDWCFGLPWRPIGLRLGWQLCMISLIADLFIASWAVITIVLVFHLFHDYKITPVRLYNALCFTLRRDWERIGSRALSWSGRADLRQVLHWRCMSTEGRADRLIDSLTSAGRNKK